MKQFQWKPWFGGSEKASLKSFYDEMKTFPNYVMRDLGMQWIDVEAIVGSVGRARELDRKFRQRGGAWNERHKRISSMMREGKPVQPIQVYLIERQEQREYFVIDGHHRVALAVQRGFQGINAFVTEIEIT